MNVACCRGQALPDFTPKEEIPLTLRRAQNPALRTPSPIAINFFTHKRESPAGSGEHAPNFHQRHNGALYIGKSPFFSHHTLAPGSSHSDAENSTLHKFSRGSAHALVRCLSQLERESEVESERALGPPLKILESGDSPNPLTA